MKKAELVFTAILVPLDFLMLLVAGLAAYYLRVSSLVAQYRPVLFHLSLPFGRYFGLIVLVSVYLLIIFALVGLYKIKVRRALWDDFSKILIGVSAGIFVLVFYIFLRQELFDSRFIILAGWFLAIVLVSLARFSAIYWQRYLMTKYHLGSHRVLIIGKDKISQRIIRNIKGEPSLGYVLAGNLDEPDLKKIKGNMKNGSIDEIILADPNWSREEILGLVNLCEENHLVFKFVPNLFQTLTANSATGTLGTIPFVEIKERLWMAGAG